VDKVDMVVMVVLEDTVDMEVNKAVEEVNMVVEVVIKLSFIFSFIFYS
jgi:hypothetical protein